MTFRQFRLLCAASAMGLACACAGASPGQPTATDAGDRGDAGPDCAANPCLCCTAGQRCVDGKVCCTPNCVGRQCGDDGCGSQCGDCAVLHDSAWTCDTVTSKCVCTPQTDLEFCAAHDQACGTLTATDNCGSTRTGVDCSARCEAPKSCHTDATCRCDAEDDAAFCSRLGKSCGEVSAADNCAASRTAQCGTCPLGKACDATNACVCAPDTDVALCAQEARDCGPLQVTDNCGARRAIASCGTCADGEVCTPDGRCLLCTQESDAEFCARRGAYCNTLTGDDNCGIPRSVSCGTCAAPATCQPNDACGDGLVPTNDTCAQPELIRLSANPAGGLIASVHGDTSAASDGTFSNCDLTATGKDVVYKFIVPPGPNMNVQLAVTPSSGSGLAAVPSIRRLCDQQSSELACAYSTSTTATVAIASRNLAPGEYFVWIDGWIVYSNGPFEMTLSLSPTPLPAVNDGCSAPQALTLVNGIATIRADNTSAINDFTGGCGAMNGGDLVYSFALVTPSAVAATVERDAWAPALLPAVYVRTTCGSAAGADQLACAVQESGVATARASYLPAGTYFVVVDSTEGTWGAFTLELTASAPLAGDTCSNAIPLLIDPVSGLATITGDTSGAMDDLASSCLTSGGGHDLVYELAVPGPAVVRADIEVIPSGTGLVAALSLRTTCAQASELGCFASPSSAPARLSFSRLEPGTYYLVVDSNAAAASGPFSLNVTLGQAPPQPANDSCTRPPALAFDAAGLATATGTTIGASDDSRGGCSTATMPHDGGDVVYAFTLGTSQNVAVSVTPSATSPAFRPAVYVRASCGDATTQRACANISNGSASTTIGNLPAGTWFVIVDGVGRTEGDFAITVAAYGAIANDACAGATALLFDASGDAIAVNDTSFATSDAVSTAAGLCAGVGSGGDLVYSFTLTQLTNVTITETPIGAGLRPVLYLRRNGCGSVAAADELSCSDPGTAGGTATLDFRKLGAGTYWIWADSYGGAPGPYVLRVHQSSPPPPPANDRCAVAIALNWSGTTASATGDTTDGNDDDRSYCSNASAPLSGPDLVYSFQLAASAQVTATVTRAHLIGYRPAVSIRASCAAADESGCALDSAGVSTLIVTLDPGTYFVFVDGIESTTFGTSSGAFTLQLSQDAPIAADGCGNPEPIAIDPASGIGTVTGDLATATNGGDGRCGGGSGGDLVYRLTLPSEKVVQVAVGNYGTSDLEPSLYLRRACADPSREVACGIGTLSIARLPAGTYYLWIDTYALSYRGQFTLTVTTTDPATPGPANDYCATAQPLIVDGPNGGAQVVADASDGVDDDAGSCAAVGSPMDGPDVVYSFTLAQAATVYATVTRHPTAPTTFSPALYLRSGCADATSEVACSSPSGGAAASIVRLLQPGTYFLFVDGQKRSAGTFILNASAQTSTAMSNEGCATAKALTFDAAGVAVAAGSTAGMVSDATGSCYPSSTAADAVYWFTLAASKQVTIDLNPASPGMYPMVYVQTSCGTPSTEKGCAFTWGYGGAELKLGTVAAGTYYVFADSPSAFYSGPFVLSVRADPPPPPPANDLCRGAQGVQIDAATGKGTVTGDTHDAVDDYVSFCSIGQTVLAGPDLVYSFTLAASASVTAKLTRDPGNSVFRPAVSIRSTCAQADELACATERSGVASVTATLPAGFYFVFVDGVSSTTPGSGSGPFTLELSTGAPSPGDSCGSALPLTIDPSTGIGTASGDLATASNSGDGSCAASSGSDLVYSFTLAQAQAVRVTLANASGSTTLHPAVHLRRTCAALRDELGCAASPTSASATFFVPRVGPGTFYVWADASAASAQGPYLLTVETSNPATLPPANDTCAAPQAIVLDPVSNGAHLRGDTSGASSDYAGTCAMTSSFPHSGGDLVYTLTLPQAATLYAVINKDPAETRAFSPAVYVRTACESSDPADEVACGSTGGNQTASFAKALAAGTYYLIVDGQNGLAGKFLLDLVARPTSTMTNENCATAQPIALDASGTALVAGSTAGLNSDGTGSCNGFSTAPDVVYSLTTSGTKNISIDLMAGAGFNPMVHVRTDCTNPTTQIACEYKTVFGVPVHIDLIGKPAGTYFIWVDGYTTYFGLFTMLVKAVDPSAPPSNDTCAGALAIALPAPGSAPLQVVASTMNSNDDYSGSCATASLPFSGPDNVYTFTTTSKLMLTATVTPTSPNLKPAIYIRSVCGTVGPADRCAYSPYAGPSNPATLGTVLGAGTWYLVVDGVSGSVGDYTLEVSTTSYDGVGATAAPLVTFASYTSVYGMATDANEVFFDHSASSIGAVAKTGGAPYMKGAADGLTPETIGFDIVEVNGSLFSLDTGTSNTTGRLWKIKDATAGWLNPPIRWDVPSGTTTSAWPATETYAMTSDGTDLIIAGGGTTSTAPVDFYALSAAAPQLPRLLGAGSVVYYARGIAADADHFYVAGTSTTGGGVWRFDRLNLAAAPLRLTSTGGYSSTLTAVRVDSLSAPQYLYARPYASGSAIHVVASPASAAPVYLGPLALPGVGSNYNAGMTFDRAGGTLYYFENATDSNGVIWKVQ